MINLPVTNIIDTQINNALNQQSSNELSSELEYAIHHQQLTLQYQPRYDSQSGQLVMLEALVRWQHPVMGFLLPDKFISTAEQHDLIVALSLQVFEQSCKDLSRIRKQLKQNVKIAVNTSLIQCEDDLYTEKLFNICHHHRLSFSDFEFELTESQSIKKSAQVLRFCKTLIALGAEISLDDFGTGQSPLNNLCDLPVHTIKIDQCFTKEIGHGGRSEILIRHLINLAHEMNIKVVAEGIESAYQRDRLIEMGCDQLQGFFMCKPLNPENLTTAHNEMRQG